MRQGCSLNPILFTILLADLEEEMKKGCWRGIKIGDDKVYTLAYADDVALLAENEDGIKGMLVRLVRYLDKKGLTLNAEKSKTLRFKKGGVE